MGKFIIQKAKEQDLTGVVDLLKKLIDFHVEIDRYYKPSSQFKGLGHYLNDALNDKNKLILVARKDNQIVGYIYGLIDDAPKYITPQKIGIIYDAFIEKNFRHLGIAKKLISEILKWFKKKQIKYIEGSVDARNKIAVSAWKKLGFFDYRIKMRKDL